MKVPIITERPNTDRDTFIVDAQFYVKRIPSPGNVFSLENIFYLRITELFRLEKTFRIIKSNHKLVLPGPPNHVF